jgi:two-component sensor histidine kinase
VSVAPVDPCPWQPLIDAAVPTGSAVEACDELPLTPEPSNVALARKFVLDKVPAADPERRDWLSVLTSELATNVVVHARTQMRVVVVLAGGDAVVGIHDLDLGRSEVVTHERDGGRGLTLIAAVAAAHGQIGYPTGGKVVWFRLPLDGTEPS